MSPSVMWQPDDEQWCCSLLLGHHSEHPSSPIPPNPPFSDTGQHMARQGQWHCTMMQQGQHKDTNEEDQPQWRHDCTRNDDEEATQPNDDMMPTQNDDMTTPHAMTRWHIPMMTRLGHTHEDNNKGPGKPFPLPSPFTFPLLLSIPLPFSTPFLFYSPLLF